MLGRRVGRTASEYGIKCTTIYTDPDAKSQHALSSPFAVNLGDPTAYLDGDRIIKAAKDNGCLAIHPGYGFVCSHMTARLSYVDHLEAEREFRIRSEMHRERSGLHWSAMGGDRSDGQQEVHAFRLT